MSEDTIERPESWGEVTFVPSNGDIEEVAAELLEAAADAGMDPSLVRFAPGYDGFFIPTALVAPPFTVDEPAPRDANWPTPFDTTGWISGPHALPGDSEDYVFVPNNGDEEGVAAALLAAAESAGLPASVIHVAPGFDGYFVPEDIDVTEWLTITSMTPNTGSEGLPATYTVVGTNLTDGTRFQMVEQGVAGFNITPIGLTDTGFTFDWTCGGGGDGVYDLVINVDARIHTLPRALTIVPGVITTVTPSSVADDTNTTYTVTGTGLGGAARAQYQVQGGTPWADLPNFVSNGDTGFTFTGQFSGPDILDVRALDSGGAAIATKTSAITIGGTPVITSVTPSEAAIGVSTLYTVVGSELPSTVAKVDILPGQTKYYAITAGSLTPTGFTFTADLRYPPDHPDETHFDLNAITSSNAVIVGLEDALTIPRPTTVTVALIGDVTQPGSWTAEATVTPATTTPPMLQSMHTGSDWGTPAPAMDPTADPLVWTWTQPTHAAADVGFEHCVKATANGVTSEVACKTVIAGVTLAAPVSSTGDVAAVGVPFDVTVTGAALPTDAVVHLFRLVSGGTDEDLGPMTEVSDTSWTFAYANDVGALNTMLTFHAESGTVVGPGTNVLLVNPTTLTSVSPTSGPTTGGTAVTLTGTKLMGTTAVRFKDTPATNLVVVNETTITVVAPASAAEEVVAVSLDHPEMNDPVSLAAAYTYTAPAPVPPTITGIDPAEGDTAGGLAVTATGTGFTGATNFLIDMKAITEFTVVNDTTITGKTPSFTTLGAKAAVVLHPNGNVEVPGLFTVVQAPDGITTLSPTSGPVSGGQSVFIGGSGLASATRVMFGTFFTDTLSSVDNTSLTARSPAITGPSTVTVTVKRPEGDLVSPIQYTYVAGGEELGDELAITEPVDGAEVDPLVTIRGTAPAGSVVDLYMDSSADGTVPVSSVTADGDGAFEFAGTTPMEVSPEGITVGVGDERSSKVTVTIAAPAAAKSTTTRKKTTR